MTRRLPGTRAGLTRDHVVAAALELMRQEGLEAVSMRRVASVLEVAPNALYTHVANKEGLVDAVLDEVLAEIKVPTRGGWRRRLEQILAATRRVLLEHPEVVPLFLTRQSIGPNALRLGEAMLSQLHDAGVRGPARAQALQLLLAHTIGLTAFELARLREPAPAGRAARARAAAAELDPSAFPHMTANSDLLARHSGDEVFEAGLRYLLDGLTPPAA